MQAVNSKVRVTGSHPGKLAPMLYISWWSLFFGAELFRTSVLLCYVNMLRDAMCKRKIVYYTRTLSQEFKVAEIQLILLSHRLSKTPYRLEMVFMVKSSPASEQRKTVCRKWFTPVCPVPYTANCTGYHLSRYLLIKNEWVLEWWINSRYFRWLVCE